MPTEPGNLLVVDDNKMNRLLIARHLEQQGHRVSHAENGKQAMTMLHAQQFDLVMLDLEMPEMDGMQVLEQLTSDAELSNIPVIIISNVEDLESVVKSIELGAEDYLHKPINPTLLRARIASSLEKKRLRDRQRELIRKFATDQVADELLSTGFSLGGKVVDATALFCDIRSFTSIAEVQTAAETIDLLSDYYALMMEAIGEEGGIVNQMVGDGLMAIFGAPLPHEDHRLRSVHAAMQMMQLLEQYNHERIALKRSPIRIGIGIASGEVIAGFTGTQRRATYTCVGDTVNLAARLESQTKIVGKPILIEECVRSGLDDSIQVQDEGLVEIKGKSKLVQVYSVKCSE
ncbi:MAG TPA: adenylate/guanylate cyclase domain-containing protein [Anaerolineales bacterium]